MKRPRVRKTRAKKRDITHCFILSEVNAKLRFFRGNIVANHVLEPKLEWDSRAVHVPLSPCKITSGSIFVKRRWRRWRSRSRRQNGGGWGVLETLADLD